MRHANLALTGLAAAVAALAAGGPARAQAPESAYSTIDAHGAGKACRKLGGGAAKDDAEGEVWRCSGVAGVELYLLHQDARDFLSYGRRGKRESGVFGLEPIGAARETVEWRGAKDAKGRFSPYATIVRFGFENPNVDRADWWSLLMVARLAPSLKDSCVVAYVDARANPDANEIARRVADRWAADAARPCPPRDQVPMVGKAAGAWKDRPAVAAP